MTWTSAVPESSAWSASTTRVASFTRFSRVSAQIESHREREAMSEFLPLHLRDIEFEALEMNDESIGQLREDAALCCNHFLGALVAHVVWHLLTLEESIESLLQGTLVVNVERQAEEGLVVLRAVSGIFSAHHTVLKCAAEHFT
jgi:hypothetical protein